MIPIIRFTFFFSLIVHCEVLSGELGDREEREKDNIEHL
jgi:hypothetical protein